MELIFRAAALALLSAVVGLLLKNRHPELALMLGTATAVAILVASLGFLSGLKEFTEQIRRILDQSEYLVSPVLKALAIAIVTSFAAELCRDSSRNAEAAAVELAGSICAIVTVLPLLMSVLKIIGGLG